MLTSRASAQSMSRDNVCVGSCPALILLCTVDSTSALYYISPDICDAEALAFFRRIK